MGDERELDRRVDGGETAGQPPPFAVEREQQATFRSVQKGPIETGGSRAGLQKAALGQRYPVEDANQDRSRARLRGHRQGVVDDVLAMMRDPARGSHVPIESTQGGRVLINPGHVTLISEEPDAVSGGPFGSGTALTPQSGS